MEFFSNWFQLGALPHNVVNGKFDFILVLLSFFVAFFASYVALNLTVNIRSEKQLGARISWLAAGAFIMGAGIWSMHFIGMLAFILPMPIEYDLNWTVGSLGLAVLVCGLALYLLQKQNYAPSHLVLGGILIGFGIASVQYVGMEGMKDTINIRYSVLPFVLSILIAVSASLAALWLAINCNKGSYSRQTMMKVLGAFVMGMAICGMHYMGMLATVFTPNQAIQINSIDNIHPHHLAFFIAGIAVLVFSLAFFASGYYRKMLVAVENEKDFLKAMLDNLDDGIIACDAKGNITVFNKALQKNMDFNKEGKTLQDLVEIFNVNSVAEKRVSVEHSPLYRALKGESIRGFVETLRFNNNRNREVVIDGQQIISSDSNLLGALLVIHDVTELKQTEKLKKEFVSIVTHELRTPLTSIRGSLGLLVGGAMGDFTEKVKKLLNIANSNCDRLLLLISDILDIEKIEAGKMLYQLKPTDLGELVKLAVDENQMYAEQYGVSLRLDQASTKIEVIVDPTRLMQVLANLISNACKFSPIGAEVVLKVKQLGEMVRVSVIDKGIGISPEFQSRIFQKFSQEDSSDSRRKGGTGLGLSISKAIIERFGGELKFISKPNEGTTFYFDIPMAHEGIKVAIDDNSEINVTSNRILLCDDDEDQSQYLKVLLESAGYIVDVSHTVSQAKELLERQNYKALILDLILPDQDGVAFIRELNANEKNKDIPIVVVSVIAQTGRSLLKEEGSTVVAWLDKPIDFNTLLASLRMSTSEKMNDKIKEVMVKENNDKNIRI